MTTHLLGWALCLFSPRLLAQQPDLAVYLRPTATIESEHREIVSKAKALTQGCSSDAKRVQALFEFVRDGFTNQYYENYKASETLKLGGNSCFRRAILLAALCRAVGIPARLHFQHVLIKSFTHKNLTQDLSFLHGLTGVFVDGEWLLYEPVGTNAKWKTWSQKESLDRDRTVHYVAGQDCLFDSTDKVLLRTLPIHFADHSGFLVEFRKRVLAGQVGFSQP